METQDVAEPIITYPYPVDADDHCETQVEAYQDISIILEKIAIEMCKTKETLRIYDPFFCEGSMVERMKKLGFMNVYNKKEDFYARLAANDLPEYDVLLTNPPYSGDHMEKLTNFVFGTNKPWFLLLPNYVYTKPYYMHYAKLTSYVSSVVFYVTPAKRYLYTTPKGRRQAKSSKFTSPFPTFWYCNMYRYTDKVFEGMNLAQSRVFKDLKSLPNTIICEHDPRAKKAKNALKRTKNKLRKKAKTA